MLAALPLGFLLLAALAFRTLRARIGAGDGVREPLVLAGVALGTWAVLGCELLTLAGRLDTMQVALWWIVGLLICLGVVAFNRTHLAPIRRPGVPLDRGDGVLLVPIALALLAAGCCAALCPPNNWDSMVYHMPRQIRWLQQGSVAHFATHEIRQLQMPPLVEFISLHLMILGGGDRLANLVQWSAYLLSVIAGSLLARECGASRRVQIATAAFIALIPMAYVQASSTKNDLVLGLWLLTATWLCLRYWRNPDLPTAFALPVGLCFGLMFLTKGTGLLFAVPVAILGAVGLLRRQRRTLPAQVVLIFLCALGLAAGHYGRNWAVFGSPTGLGNTAGEQYQNETRKGRVLLSNIVRNVSLHLGTPSDALNQRLTDAVVGLHGPIGMDASDPRTTYLSGRFKVFRYFDDDDTVGAPVHVLLSILAVALLPFVTRNPAARWAWLVLGVAIACFLLFCLMLKWQPWHARLHLPIQVLLAVPMALLFSGRHARITLPLTLAAMLIVLVPTALWNRPRPLLGPRSVFVAPPERLLFNKRPDLEEPARAVVDYVVARQPAIVALPVAGDNWIYPLQRMLLDRLDPPPRLISFHTGAGRGPQPDPAPPDITVSGNYSKGEIRHRPSGVTYRLAERIGPYAIFLPETRPPQAPSE